MLFQLFCTLSVCCQITSTGSRAQSSLHLSGIFPDRQKKGAWDRRTSEGLGLNEHFKCWSQVIRRSQWDQQRTEGLQTFPCGWFLSWFSKQGCSSHLTRCLTGTKWNKNACKLSSCSIMNCCFLLFYHTVGRSKQKQVETGNMETADILFSSAWQSKV